MRPGIITALLLSLVLVLQLGSLYAVTKMTRVNDHEQAMLSTVHTMESHTENLINQTQQFLAPIASQLSISRQIAADGLMNIQDNRILELFFLSQLRSNPAMNAMYLGRYDGSFVAVARFDKSLLPNYSEPVLRAKVVSISDESRQIQWQEYSLAGELLEKWSDHDDSYDPRVRTWYQEARGHDRPVWTDAFSMTGTENHAIAASVNLQNAQKEEVGVLGVSVELSELNNLLASLPLLGGSSAVILDNMLNSIAVTTPVDAAQADTHEQVLRSDASLFDKHGLNLQGTALINSIKMGSGNSFSSVNRHWYSQDEKTATLQRQIQLFEGAIQWLLVMQSPVVQHENLHTSSESGVMFRTMAVIVLPGLLAVLCIVGLREPLQRLHSRATIDYLTKAFNREEFISRFTKRLHNARLRKRGSERWVGVLLDLDGFKQINDLHGHDAGDAILKAVVSRLQQTVGRAGFVGRLGGDEFAVALKVKPGANPAHVVECIRRKVVAKPICSAKGQHQVGMTAGVAVADARKSVSELLECADHALVSGKLVNKNTTYDADAKVSTNQLQDAGEIICQYRLDSDELADNDEIVQNEKRKYVA